MLPQRIPCYDFILISNPTLKATIYDVKKTLSGLVKFADVTGGVYKARERIHRHIADWRLLAIPTSCRRVAAYNPNYG